MERIDDEMELADTLTCDELCVLDKKKAIKDIMDEKIHEKDCECQKE